MSNVWMLVIGLFVIFMAGMVVYSVLDICEQREITIDKMWTEADDEYPDEKYRKYFVSDTDGNEYRVCNSADTRARRWDDRSERWKQLVVGNTYTVTVSFQRASKLFNMRPNIGNIKEV